MPFRLTFFPNCENNIEHSLLPTLKLMHFNSKSYNFCYYKVKKIYKTFICILGRVSEPAIKIDGFETLRHILYRYIIAHVNESIYFLITLGTLLKSLFTNLLYIWALGAGSRRLQNPNFGSTNIIFAECK